MSSRPTFQQLQQKREYYQFPATLDVDRYKKDGKEQDTVVGLRELNISGYPEAATGSTTTSRTPTATAWSRPRAPGHRQQRRPGLHRVGTADHAASSARTSSGSTTARRPRSTPSSAGPQKELDYDDDNGEKTTSYTGNSGVNLSNPVNRAAYAVAFSEPQILYSGAIGEGSRILYNRTPKERVEAVAPWLTIDGDAYPAVVDGRIQWIVDAYTTTNGYPVRLAYDPGDTTADSLTDNQRAVVAQQNQVNYIRNSVKATVDAYTGKVKLYQWDTKDPVLKTWMKAFPDTVQAEERHPART